MTPKARSSTASNGPEKVLPHGFPAGEPLVNVDHLGIHDVVDRDTVLPHHVPVTPAAEKPADSHRRANRHRKAIFSGVASSCATFPLPAMVSQVLLVSSYRDMPSAGWVEGAGVAHVRTNTGHEIPRKAVGN